MSKITPGSAKNKHTNRHSCARHAATISRLRHRVRRGATPVLGARPPLALQTEKRSWRCRHARSSLAITPSPASRPWLAETGNTNWFRVVLHEFGGAFYQETDGQWWVPLLPLPSIKGSRGAGMDTNGNYSPTGPRGPRQRDLRKQSAS